jgi:effector-binding domain-containing protein
MATTTPKIETRPEQHYAGIRTQVPFTELPVIIPESIVEVENWLLQQGIGLSGAPFIRYHVINMAGKLDVEVGWPTASPVQDNGRIKAGSLPAGKYASLIYTGTYDKLVDGNAALIGWAEKEGINLDSWQTADGDAFGARYESYLTNPEEVPDQSKHETEVAIRIAD